MESINEIFELMKDIYGKYEKKKLKIKALEKLRKKHIKRNFAKLKKIVTNTMDNCDIIGYKQIIDYFQQLTLLCLPKGNFKHTLFTKSSDLSMWFTSVVQFSIKHPEEEYKCQIVVEYRLESGIKITYSCFSHDDPTKKILSFSDDKVISIELSKELSDSLKFQGFNINLEGDIIRNEFFKILRDDTRDFILDKIQFYEERMEFE